MNHPLDGIRCKIIRAEVHLATVGTEVARHLELCEITGEKNCDDSTESMVVVDYYARFPDPTLLLSVIAGDCLHNLRSALDHLV